ncbi:TBC25 protein, partial [Polypterus senegalus]
MSDIASPILAVMDNEAHAFICFCGIMKRLEGNFHTDGHLMSVKFQHLKLLLRYSDPEFYTYLLSKGADDLFFCYRWLLLELKREFAFEDALRMLEVTWSSLPPDPPETEVELVGLPFEQWERTTTGAEDNPSERQRYRHMLRPTQEQELGSQDHEQSLMEPRGWGQRLNPDFLEGREEEHRDHIMKNNLTTNELAMHFDRLVRKHNLNRILHRAKALFADYLHSEVWDSEEVDEAAANSDSPSSHTPQPPSFSS